MPITHPKAPGQMERERRERHRRWIASLSRSDWARIMDHARATSSAHMPARLENLDAKGIAVSCCPVDHARYFSGEKIGTVLSGTIAVLVWEV